MMYVPLIFEPPRTVSKWSTMQSLYSGDRHCRRDKRVISGNNPEQRSREKPSARADEYICTQSVGSVQLAVNTLEKIPREYVQVSYMRVNSRKRYVHRCIFYARDRNYPLMTTASRQTDINYNVILFNSL